MNKRVLIAAAGTGGHLFPAIGFAEALEQQFDNLDISFAGHKLNENSFFAARYPSYNIEAALLSKSPVKMMKSVIKNTHGVLQSLKILRINRPDVVIGFGSYHTAPLLLAATILKVPYFLFAADSVPGRVIRLFAPYARYTGLFYPEAQTRVKGVTIPQGLPLRDRLKRHLGIHRDFQRVAKELYGFCPEKQVLLVIGGSQGARSLNEIIPKALKAGDSIQVLHLAGSSEEKKIVDRRYLDASISACVLDFEKNMEYAYSAADAVIARSGASTIAEILAFQKPSLLIPYPHSQDGHQSLNAHILEQNGCSFVLQEGELEMRLSQAVEKLFQDDVVRNMQKQQSVRFQELTCCSLLDQISAHLKGS